MKKIEDYTSQELYHIIQSRNDMLIVGEIIHEGNIECWFDQYNIKCTQENKNKFFENADIYDLCDEVNMAMESALENAGFELNCKEDEKD